MPVCIQTQTRDCCKPTGPTDTVVCLAFLATPQSMPPQTRVPCWGQSALWFTVFSLTPPCSYKSGLFPAFPQYKLYWDEWDFFFLLFLEGESAGQSHCTKLP